MKGAEGIIIATVLIITAGVYTAWMLESLA
jgi:hypothetical protein